MYYGMYGGGEKKLNYMILSLSCGWIIIAIFGMNIDTLQHRCDVQILKFYR